MSEPIRLSLPLNKSELANLRSGQACLLTGEMYVLRDAGHVRLLQELEEQGSLPYGLAGQMIFYAGPTPASAGRPFGSIGPTTASRMDFATPQLLRAGVAATLGKGTRSKSVVDAIKETGAIYFAAVGGVAALLAKCITKEEIIAYEDLGTEALRKITVRDFPVFVGIDTLGNCLYDIDAPQGCEDSDVDAPQVGEGHSVDVPQVGEGSTFAAPQVGEDNLQEQAKHKGVFITFEGGEGVGKSTHISRLAEELSARGYEVLCLREPGGTKIGEELRQIVLDPQHAEMTPEAELLIYEAARAQIVSERIIPALNRGAVVLCDRFYDSTIAYQAYGRGLSREFIEHANAFACQGVVPDRTILMVAGNQEEAAASAKENLIRATNRGADRLELAGVSFHVTVNAAFAKLAQENSNRIRTVKFCESKDETYACVLSQVEDLFVQTPAESFAQAPAETVAHAAAQSAAANQAVQQPTRDAQK